MLVHAVPLGLLLICSINRLAVPGSLCQWSQSSPALKEGGERLATSVLISFLSIIRGVLALCEEHQIFIFHQENYIQ